MRIAAIGDNVIDRYVSHGVGFVGGNCVNVAVFAARAGARSTYVGQVGADPAGEQVRQALADEKVDVQRVHVRTGSTAWCDIEHSCGDRVFVDSDKGVRFFAPDANDLALLADRDLIHTSYCSGMEEYVETFARIAPVSFDFSTRLEEDYLARVAPHLTVAEFSGGHLDDDERERLFERMAGYGVRTILVTRGAHGVELVHDGERYALPALDIDVVDTLGAGDAFIGTFLVGLSSKEPHGALEDATAVACHTCEKFGGFGKALPLESVANTCHSLNEERKHA